MASNDVTQRKRRKHYVKCCVFECPNNNKNRPELQFYGFPKASVFHPEKVKQRQAWIKAVKLQYSDGTNWEPTDSTKICSEHFAGKSKSIDPCSLSYNPTIFPKVYKVSRVNEQTILSRQKRKIKRDIELKAKIQSLTNKKPKTKDQETQVDFLEDDNNEIDIFICNKFKGFTVCEAETQARRSLPKSNSETTTSKREQIKIETKKKDDKWNGFKGIASIRSEEEMKNVCGISQSAFQLLLKVLSERKQDKSNEKPKISLQNKLLIFLMRMKCGLNFSVLSVLFGVESKMIANIFNTTLSYLALSCKNLVFWPNKKVVQDTMPAIFKPGFENCRVIIDSTEFYVQQPPVLEQRVEFYSHRKKGYRLKNVIACTPCGFISFVSRCYCGRAPDPEIIAKSKLLDLLEPGDVVLADKSFSQIKTMLDKTGKNISLVTPPLLEKSCFSDDEINLMFNTEKQRIQVERVIQKIRNFKLVNEFTIDMLYACNDIVFMCCVLVNLQAPVMKRTNILAKPVCKNK